MGKTQMATLHPHETGERETKGRRCARKSATEREGARQTEEKNNGEKGRDTENCDWKREKEKTTAKGGGRGVEDAEPERRRGDEPSRRATHEEARYRWQQAGDSAGEGDGRQEPQIPSPR